MAVNSKFDVCSVALTRIGGNTISDFTSGEGPICEQLYDNMVQYLQSIYPWIFNTTRISLGSPVSEAPAFGWTYTHQLPTNPKMINMRGVYDSDADGALPLKQFQRVRDKIFSNRNLLWLEYQFEAEVGDWPAYFTNLVIAAMASDLSIPITSKTDRAEYWHQVAFGTPQENGRGGLFARAMQIDAQQQPNKEIQQDDGILIATRY